VDRLHRKALGEKLIREGIVRRERRDRHVRNPKRNGAAFIVGHITTSRYRSGQAAL
jgi:hypothetical protein